MKKIVYTTLVLAVTGCVSHREYTTKIRPEKAIDLSSSEEIVAKSASMEVGEFPTSNWWQVYDDTQLDSCIQTAIENSPDLKTAEAKVQVALQEANISKSKLFPNLNFKLDDDWQHLSNDVWALLFNGDTSFNLIDISLKFKYEFDFWGKNRDQFEAMLGRARAQKAEKDQTRLILSIATGTEYFNYMALHAKMHQAKALLKDRKALYKLMKIRAEHRVSDALDLVPYDIAIYEMEQFIENLREQISITKHHLNTLMGKSADAPLDLVVRWEHKEIKLPVPENLGLNLLAQRPDLQAQILLVDSAAKEIGVARKAFYPNIDLGMKGGFQSLQLHNLFSQRALFGAFQPALNLPIYEGGKLRANLAMKMASFDQMVHHYNQMLLNAAEEVSNSVTSIASLEKEMNLQLDRLESIYTGYNLTLSRFNHGIDTYLTVLSEEEKVLQTKMQMIDYEWAHALKGLALIQSLGGGFDE